MNKLSIIVLLGVAAAAAATGAALVAWKQAELEKQARIFSLLGSWPLTSKPDRA